MHTFVRLHVCTELEILPKDGESGANYWATHMKFNVVIGCAIMFVGMSLVLAAVLLDCVFERRRRGHGKRVADEPHDGKSSVRTFQLLMSLPVSGASQRSAGGLHCGGACGIGGFQWPCMAFNAFLSLFTTWRIECVALNAAAARSALQVAIRPNCDNNHKSYQFPSFKTFSQAIGGWVADT